MKPMQVRILGFDVSYDTKPTQQENIRRVTIECDGQEFIIEADAGGLVIKSRGHSGIMVKPNKYDMIHLTQSKS